MEFLKNSNRYKLEIICNYIQTTVDFKTGGAYVLLNNFMLHVVQVIALTLFHLLSNLNQNLFYRDTDKTK